MIACDDIVVKYIMKTSEMIKAVCAAAASGTGTKMTIESFEKREDAIFTSHLSAIELDTQVKYNLCTKKAQSPNLPIKITIIIMFQY